MIKIKQVPVRLDDELHKKLKIIVIERNTSIQEVLEKFLKTYIEEYQKEKEQKKK